MGRGLPWNVTDCDAAGDILSHVMKVGQALDVVHKEMRATGQSM
jgi:hypothetical protein